TLQRFHRFRRPAALEQRLAAVEVRQTAGAGPAGGSQRLQVRELDRPGGAGELAMQLGAAEIDDAERERGRRLPGRVERGPRRLEHAGGVAVMPLLVQPW